VVHADELDAAGVNDRRDSLLTAGSSSFSVADHAMSGSA
jgi:hypothetical protein